RRARRGRNDGVVRRARRARSRRRRACRVRARRRPRATRRRRWHARPPRRRGGARGAPRGLGAAAPTFHARRARSLPEARRLGVAGRGPQLTNPAPRRSTAHVDGDGALRVVLGGGRGGALVRGTQRARRTSSVRYVGTSTFGCARRRTISSGPPSSSV